MRCTATLHYPENPLVLTFSSEEFLKTFLRGYVFGRFSKVPLTKILIDGEDKEEFKIDMINQLIEIEKEKATNMRGTPINGD